MAMKYRWNCVARSWGGLVAAILVVGAAAWLLAAYINACYVIPRDKATVDELKKKATLDAEVQKILQPELDRQHRAVVARRNAYNRGGYLLLVSFGLFLAWYKWLRPSAEECVGIPHRLRGFVVKLPQRGKRSPKPKIAG